MTLLPKKLRNDSRLKPIINTSTSTSTPLPTHTNNKFNESSTKQLWEPLKQQIIEKKEDSQTLSTDPDDDKTTTHDTKIAALHAIKQKFMPKEIVALPWDKYKSTTATATTSTALVKTDKKQTQQQRYGSQYDQMMNDLALSHAQVAAAEFQTLSIIEADKLAKKSSQLKKQLDAMYDQLRVHLRTTRATVKSLNLSIPYNTEIAQLKHHVYQSEQELEEFYFMNKYANHVQTRHLQHLAGTLLSKYSTDPTPKEGQLVCSKNEEQTNNNNDFLRILHLLRAILDAGDTETESSPSSVVSLKTSKCSSSSSSAASISLDSLSNAPTDEILQQITEAIEKISQRSMVQKEAIQSFEVQSKMAETKEELLKQRERSAELVLKLEKKRLLVSKEQELAVTKLKEQLSIEKSLRKSLQGRVATLEQELEGKELLVNSYDTELTNLKDQRDSHKSEIRDLKNKLKANSVELDMKLLSNLKQEKEMWQKTQKKLLDESGTVIQSESGGGNLEDNITQLVQKYKENGKALDTSQQALKEAQKMIDQFRAEKESFLKTSDKVINKCHAEINDKDKLNKTDLAEVVETTIQLLKSEHTVKTSPEDDRAEQYRIKHSNSLLRIKQQELMQLQEKCDNVIKVYTTRESAYILQSASTEAELERLLKEYDRLTRNITDFNSERKKFEYEIRKLQIEKVQLSKQLCDKEIINIYGNDSILRKEFRDLMATVKEKHKQELLKEINARLKVEHLLREKMSEKESKRWERVDIAVQTHLQLLP